MPKQFLYFDRFQTCCCIFSANAFFLIYFFFYSLNNIFIYCLAISFSALIFLIPLFSHFLSLSALLLTLFKSQINFLNNLFNSKIDQVGYFFYLCQFESRWQLIYKFIKLYLLFIFYFK